MKKWIIEFKIHWSDGVIDVEQIIHVNAETKETAIRIGKERIKKLDKEDNVHMHMAYREFYRCVEEDNFRYLSSIKEPQLTGFQGYKDVTKWSGL